MPLNRMTEWPGLETYIEGIFARRFYANHGPLELAAENAIIAAVGTQYASLIANDMFALILAIRAAAPAGKVLVPSRAPHGTLEAVTWAGLQPVLIGALRCGSSEHL